MTPENTTAELSASTAAFAATAEHLHLDSSAIDKIGTLTLTAAALRHEGDAVFAVIPADSNLVDVTAKIEAAALTPRRKTGTVHLADVTSFATYVSQQGSTDSTYIYADPDNRSLVAVLNDHTIGTSTDGASPAGRRDHRATYQAEYSREFAIWLAHNAKKMTQEDFAIFLEDNIADIAPPTEGDTLPTGEKLLAVAMTLQAKTEVEFKSHKRLDNGEVQLTYNEQTTASAGADNSLTIPREFAIGLRLFKNGEGFKIRARLKYRLAAKAVMFWYELDRPQNAVEAAFKNYVDAAAGSGFTVLTGKP